jgi:putative membrane protein insertion efficiency factor
VSSKQVALACIRWYQRELAPIVGRRCRFEPSCSEYARRCTLEFGAVRGAGLAYARYLRCHPQGGSGVDLPPVAVTICGIANQLAQAVSSRRRAKAARSCQCQTT